MSGNTTRTSGWPRRRGPRRTKPRQALSKPSKGGQLMADRTNLAAVNHVVVLMLENRSFDHMLGYLYAGSGNISPSGQQFEGLTGNESCPDSSGNQVSVYQITPSTPNAYFMPGADPGEGFKATNDQLWGSDN